MAGRPRRMLRRVEDLEVAAFALAFDVFLAAPEQYTNLPARLKGRTNDAVASAWRSAVRAATVASTALERLGDVLRAKAGVTEPGPVARALPTLAEPDDATPTG
ncbi:hypothetical protein RAS1_03590 [Phycisphaerae bacterium RAS1]|nr:hypothetical protein RAS1_03590 [Phycisphaerae bacterium RAS1]